MSFSTLDNLATWMLTNIRLSRYDDQFVNNLTLYITQHNRITSNQDALFKKVALKYVRQFNNYKININEFINLPWSVSVVKSVPEYTGATIKIENNKIIFRSPYNKNFLSALRKNNPHNLSWIKDLRQYESPYSPSTLKSLVHLSADFYQVINYCEVTKQIIDSLSAYESIKYWTPTLIYKNGYYIAAINEHVFEATKDIPLSDDLKSIAQLVKYGISIDQSVKDHLYKQNEITRVNIACNFYLSVEIRDAKNILNILKDLGCDGASEAKKLSLYHELNFNDSDFHMCKTSKELKDLNNPVVFCFTNNIHLHEPKPYKLFKIVRFVNSDPVNLGTR